MTILYGLANCDTVKKARRQLEKLGVAHDFHDFKKLGVPAARLDGWMAEVGWQKLINRQGTTWRKLAPEAQAGVVDEASARQLMLTQPSVIKRPVLEAGGRVLVGYDEAAYAALA